MTGFVNACEAVIVVLEDKPDNNDVMQKISLLFITLFFTGNLFAQTEKGSCFSGPAVNAGYAKSSYSYNNPDNSAFKNQSVSINTTASIGYFVANNLAIGPGIVLDYRWGKTTRDYLYNKDNRVTLGIDPFVRYYIGRGKKLKFFAEATAGVRFSKDFYEYNSPDVYSGITVSKEQSNSTSINAGISAGITWFVNQVIGIEGSLSYNYDHSFGRAQFEGVDFKQTDLSLNFGVGFKYYFAKKKKE